jgi:hypothetical protein
MRCKRLIPGVWSALRRLGRSERGFAVPTVLMVIIAGLGLSGAVVTGSIYAQHGSVRDRSSKDALAAADAGLQLALYRQNKITTTSVLPCVVQLPGGNLAPGASLADGWCPTFQSSSSDHLPPGTSFAYRVKPWTLVGTTQTGRRRQLEVVSVGTSENVNRRLEVTATARDGSGVYGTFSAMGVDQVTINGNSQIGGTSQTTNAATNGSIVTYGSGLLCGDAKYGLDGTFTGNQCAGYNVYEEELSLPPVDPGTAWTDNSNGRFFTLDRVQPPNAVSTNCSGTVNGNQGRVCWNATTRVLTMQGKATLTLGASDKPYSFCQLNMSGSSHLIVARGAVVTIIFHSPETCGQTGNPVTQVNMTGNTQIDTTSGNPYDLRIVMVGSDDIPTKAHFTGNTGSELTIYAPRTDVELWGSTAYFGAVAGKTLTLGGSADFYNDDRAGQAQIPISIVYHRDRYVECTGGAMPNGLGTHPDDSC